MTLRRLALVPFLPLVAWAGTDRVPIEVDGQPFTTFYYGQQSNNPYPAPLRAPSGKIVTRHYPMEKVEGESRDHIHHTGLWFSYDDVNGVKFWENDPSYKPPNKGTIVVQSAKLESGAGSTVFKAGI